MFYLWWGKYVLFRFLWWINFFSYKLHKVYSINVYKLLIFICLYLMQHNSTILFEPFHQSMLMVPFRRMHLMQRIQLMWSVQQYIKLFHEFKSINLFSMRSIRLLKLFYPDWMLWMWYCFKLFVWQHNINMLSLPIGRM